MNAALRLPGQAFRLAVRVVRLEVNIWVSLYRWVFRRPARIAPGTVTFGYGAAAAPLFWVFIGISAVEIPILDLLLPTLTWRLVGLGLGLWGLLWMLGLLASMYVCPHLVGPDGIRIRSGFSVDHVIGWDEVAEVRVHREKLPGNRTLQLTDAPEGAALHVTVSSETTVQIVLATPRTVRVPKAGPTAIHVICAWTDDPAGFLTATRENLLRAGAEID
ncbi:hypothetical protein [Nakamurella deserti]|uniref:hypothetical protein n=1 Tax=Nakamurella deserti TaxID=2164074 RepID=UPI000DBE0F8F|nr:hypothetical protein [Nakamurella deserti]